MDDASFATAPGAARPANRPSDLPTPLQGGLYDPRFEHDACGLGLVADLGGVPTHRTLADALTLLERLDHRGATGADAFSGDGAGVLLALPRRLLERRFGALPDAGRLAVAVVFLPRAPGPRARAAAALEAALARTDVRPLAWADVPTEPDGAALGVVARASMPHVAMLACEDACAAAPGADAAARDARTDAFERRLFVARRRFETGQAALPPSERAYVVSLSARTLVYKGMLTPAQLAAFYPDLRDAATETAVALVHSRFSTNTFPSWERAQPMRLVAHNGEINTVGGNLASLTARAATLDTTALGCDRDEILPVADATLSDTGIFDAALELRVRAGGQPLAHALARMVPPAWENDDRLGADLAAFYAFGACTSEPWDGPAALVATDGRTVVATLDRNGLRPCRVTLTTDGRVVLASEAGALPLDPSLVAARTRLGAGRPFVIDLVAGRVAGLDETLADLAAARPYRAWLDAGRTAPADLPAAAPVALPADTGAALRAFDYSNETVRAMLVPLVRDGRDPLGSMGNDEAPAVLSRHARLLPNYFRQRFAQVTNPPMDSTREACVMSLARPAGPEGPFLRETPAHARRLWLDHPVLDDDTAARLAAADADLGPRGRWHAARLDATFAATAAPSDDALARALDRLCADADAALAGNVETEGATILIVSDLAVSPARVPVPILLAVGALHRHLRAGGRRTAVLLIAESGEARTVHQIACLVGYGADAVHPALAYAAIESARRSGLLPGVETRAEAVAAYRASVGKGLLKVMAKMGVATLDAYRGAGLFEAFGLAPDVIAAAFPGTPSRIGGTTLAGLAAEARARHARAYGSADERDVARRPDETLAVVLASGDGASARVSMDNGSTGESGPATGDRSGSGGVPLGLSLPSNGRFAWRAGEAAPERAWGPETIADVQAAARRGDADAYARYAARLNGDAHTARTLSGLVGLRAVPAPLPLDAVEPAASIVRRFVTGAMSLGSLSAEAHETLAVAMNRIGGKSNTGEGGEDPARSVPGPSGDLRRSAIKQIASGRFGVTLGYLVDADELQIKMAQGAKPGEGGELPGHKVVGDIARIRHATPGVGLISPPPHHDIYSIEDLKQLLFDLRAANPTARLSVKLVAEMGVGTVAAGVVKAGAAHVLVSGDSGGTGASPLTSIKHAGLPWEIGLAETHQTLTASGLRRRVVLQTDGGLRTGRDVVVAALLGAEEFGFSTAPLIALGCLMMRKCHLNTCPVGIATQDPVLRARFDGQPEHVVSFLFAVADEVRGLLSTLGFATLGEAVGRVDRLDAAPALDHFRADGLDLSALLAPATPPATAAAHAPSAALTATAFDAATALDRRLIADTLPALAAGSSVRVRLTIENTDRSVGTRLSGEIARAQARGEVAQALPDDVVVVDLAGAAGQSFGAFLARGVTLRLSGEANDYVGKGLSGGRIVVRAEAACAFEPSAQVIAGNVLLYGATSGEVLVGGRVGERFAVRLSGARVVVEGCGDHGCEYMTGGLAIVLGPTGRNFAAGMSGGIAVVLDDAGSLGGQIERRVAAGVSLARLSDLAAIDGPETTFDAADDAAARALIARHAAETGSHIAAALVADWPAARHRLVRVLPHDERRVRRAAAA